MRHALFPLTLCSVLMFSAASAQDAPANTPQATPAGVITMEKAPVPVTVTLSGQASAQDEATIRPLVSGIVTDILYQPGAEVSEGDPLFRIDDSTYEADVAAAQAALESAQSAVPAAEAALTRSERLIGTGVTQETLDTARVTLAQANAAVSSAEAALKSAQISLDRATIRSPISGFVASPEVSVGDLVTASQADALTSVTRLDPIYVDLSEANARMLMMRSRIESGDIEPGDALDVALELENGALYEGKGTLQVVGRNVSTSTGTRTIRVQFDNPDAIIMPGMFVTATLTLGTTDAYLVPQLASSPNADGTVSVWVLDDDNRARELRLSTLGSTRSAWIVTTGMDEGATMLVDNIDEMIEGTEIAPVPTTISQQGVISDDAAADAESEG